jgi:hypothetical protein
MPPFLLSVRAAHAVLCLSFAVLPDAMADDRSKTDARYPFRTEFANANLPWYQPKPLEFPPHHSDRRISGELVSADFIHRSGQFRASQTGELMDFTMPPYGAVNYLNAEADLRDVPLGTVFLFFLNQDAQGSFTRLATMQDQFTMDASHRFTYRLDELKLGEGRLLTTKESISKNQSDLGKKELLVKPETRVWKGEQQVKLADLAPGDELLFNITGKTAESPGWCTDIWAGAQTHKLASEQQAKKFAEFTKRRGIPGWIDKTEGNLVTVTFFSGDTRTFRETWLNEIAVGKSGGKLCVANDELRTWNPPVDGEGFTITDVRAVPTDRYGCSGTQITVKVGNMLEGFRRGRVVRVFAPGWKAQDEFYGESLMGYGFGRMLNQELVENVAKEYPEQFPFRTDYGNAQLPWFKLQAGKLPPPFAEHLVIGELVSADAATRTGRFHTERTGETVEFTLLPEGTVKFLNAKASLADIPPGTRCRFSLFHDGKGAFTRASLVTDEFTRLAANVITHRVEALKLAEGRLLVAQQLPEVKNYNGDMERPPDIGRCELRVSDATRVWKGEQEVKLADLAVGDVLLVNLTSEQNGAPSTCTDIWIGAETHKLVSERQSKKNPPGKKK